MKSRNRANGWIRFGLSLLIGALLVTGAGNAWALECTGGTPAAPVPLPIAGLNPIRAAAQPNLLVTGYCVADKTGPYYFGVVNILDGGTITFSEQVEKPNTKTEFWANSIIIEKGGTLEARARVGSRTDLPYGLYGGTLTIYLYGSNHGSGPPCLSPGPIGGAPCGIPAAVWKDGQTAEQDLPGGVKDYFYKYGTLHGDWYCTSPSSPTTVTQSYFDGKKGDSGACVNAQGQATLDKPGYFGGKVLAVSYGGTLDLKGLKGADYVNDDPESSGFSWMRLSDGINLPAGATELALERAPLTWAKDDEIVVTTTDYLPSHSEKLKIVGDDYKGEAYVRFRAIVDDSDSRPNAGLQWPHNGTRYGGPNDVAAKRLATRLPDRMRQKLDRDLVQNGAETRAAVALLTRSIRIVSAGDTAGTSFGQSLREDPIIPYYYYGAHMVVRQGFKRVAVQGVEFVQMGQGGRLGHYPVHFHMARKTPKDNAYIKDSSINESMTRWIVLHSTQGVTVARNVGYKSIGHGFYLEDGTEIDNKFHSNIGIFARAAVDYDHWYKPGDVTQNPRRIAGILADNGSDSPAFPYRSDVDYPTVFWISNGWNDFIGNMAAGAGTCGAAYWLVPASNSDHVEVSPNEHEHMKWKGYASQQARVGGTVPLRTFDKNYATSTMMSLQTTADAPPCHGVIAADATPSATHRELRAVKSFAPPPKRTANGQGLDNPNDPYYPHVFNPRAPTICRAAPDGDCSTVPTCAKGALELCAATVINRYTSSFHWAHGNVSALWLRPQWYLLTNSVISDVQNGGLTFVSGGDYTQVITGYWALVKDSLFIGNTIDNNKNVFTRNVGPFNVERGTELLCDRKEGQPLSNYCLSAANGISMPINGFMTNQRLQNIYDGPSYQDTNAYLDITPVECDPWVANKQTNCMYGSSTATLRLKSTKPKENNRSWCYLPNAAIGWKQPNGFYYPPSFHSKELFFDNVDLRHYVIDPLFTTPAGVPKDQGGTYITDDVAVRAQYCLDPSNTAYTIFDNWTSIDRQTVLNDDDGTLTGLTNEGKNPLPAALQQTISVNDDAFFNAPAETAECGSAVGDNGDANCKTADPKQSPATAKTSPYDYLSTVVHRTNADDMWDHDCGGPFCYGVPLYRQYLTASELSQWSEKGCKALKPEEKTPAQCRWPFIRMAGTDIAQRQTMTVNNGRYYLDTNVSKEMQKSGDKYTNDPNARKYNVFQAKQTYKVFFVYAKETTAQFYDVYVGKGLNFNDQTDFSPIRVDISVVTNFDTKALDYRPVSNVQWAKGKYDKGTGILSVTINFAGEKELEPTRANGLCQPQSMCRADGHDCVSTLPVGDPLKKDRDSVCKWAAKDLDCPVATYTGTGTNKKFAGGGCFGFSFTLPEGFEPNDLHRRPQPDPFPVSTQGPGKPDWMTKFKTIEAGKAGARCTYTSAPNRNCLPP